VAARTRFLTVTICWLQTRALAGLLWAGAAWRVRACRGWLGEALSILVPAITRRSGKGSLLDVKTTDAVAAAGETSVEVVLPEGGSSPQLSCSGWSVVVRVDAVGGPPYADFTEEGDTRSTARRGPDRWRAVLVSVSSDMSGEVGDQLGALGQILTPNGMIMKRLRDSG
jgi:hypothetical protein